MMGVRPYGFAVAPASARPTLPQMPASDRALTSGPGLLPEKASLAPVLAVIAAFLLLYARVLAKLVHDWGADENYSHGFLVIPLALYFVWERRDRIAALPVH